MQYEYQLENSPRETKMTQKLKTIGHHYAFNDEQRPYRIDIKVPKMTNVKQFKR